MNRRSRSGSGSRGGGVENLEIGGVREDEVVVVVGTGEAVAEIGGGERESKGEELEESG